MGSSDSKENVNNGNNKTAENKEVAVQGKDAVELAKIKADILSKQLQQAEINAKKELELARIEQQGKELQLQKQHEESALKLKMEAEKFRLDANLRKLQEGYKYKFKRFLLVTFMVVSVSIAIVVTRNSREPETRVTIDDSVCKRKEFDSILADAASQSPPPAPAGSLLFRIFLYVITTIAILASIIAAFLYFQKKKCDFNFVKVSKHNEAASAKRLVVEVQHSFAKNASVVRQPYQSLKPSQAAAIRDSAASSNSSRLRN